MGQKTSACQGNLPLIVDFILYIYNTSLNSGRLLVDYGHVVLNKKFRFPRVTLRSAIVFSIVLSQFPSVKMLFVRSA